MDGGPSARGGGFAGIEVGGDVGHVVAEVCHRVWTTVVTIEGEVEHGFVNRDAALSVTQLDLGSDDGIGRSGCDESCSFVGVMAPCGTGIQTVLCQEVLRPVAFFAVRIVVEIRNVPRFDGCMMGRVFSFLSNALVAALVLGAALPGTHRFVWPEAFGLTEIAPHVWTDAPERRGALLALVETARGRVETFFGDRVPRGVVVLCTSAACARDFGIGGNGLSIAYLAVMVAPGGLTVGTLSHEMTHARLHRSMGVGNLVRQPYPTWFDEGLATHVADHPRGGGSVTAASRARVRDVVRFWQLQAAFEELGVGRTYGSAAAEVADIERAAGRAGLLELIARTEAQEAFAPVLAEIMRR